MVEDLISEIERAIESTADIEMGGQVLVKVSDSVLRNDAEKLADVISKKLGVEVEVEDHYVDQVRDDYIIAIYFLVIDGVRYEVTAYYTYALDEERGDLVIGMEPEGFSVELW